MLGWGVSLGKGVSLGVGVLVGGSGVLVKVAGVRFGVLVGSGVLGVNVGLGVFVGAGVVFCAVGTAVFDAWGVCPGAEYTFKSLVFPVVVA